jgi:hypothetical protein
VRASLFMPKIPELTSSAMTVQLLTIAKDRKKWEG